MSDCKHEFNTYLRVNPEDNYEYCRHCYKNKYEIDGNSPPKEKELPKKLEKKLAAIWARQEWLGNKIMAYLEGGHGLTSEQLYEEEDDDKHMEMRRRIADAIEVDFDEVDYAISKMFF